MSSLNVVLIIGQLARDPEVRFTAVEEPACTLRIAASGRFGDKAGESRELTEGHRVVLYRRLAEICLDHLSKGALVRYGGHLFG